MNFATFHCLLRHLGPLWVFHASLTEMRMTTWRLVHGTRYIASQVCSVDLCIGLFLFYYDLNWWRARRSWVSHIYKIIAPLLFKMQFSFRTQFPSFRLRLKLSCLAYITVFTGGSGDGKSIMNQLYYIISKRHISNQKPRHVSLFESLHIWPNNR